MRSKMTRMSRVGAIFHEGVTSRASGTWNSTANWATRSGVGVTAAKRPHMTGLQLSGRFKRQIRIGEFGRQIIGPSLDDLNAHLAEHAAHRDALQFDALSGAGHKNVVSVMALAAQFFQFGIGNRGHDYLVIPG